MTGNARFPSPVPTLAVILAAIAVPDCRIGCAGADQGTVTPRNDKKAALVALRCSRSRRARR
jgi:hypothetical protein